MRGIVPLLCLAAFASCDQPDAPEPVIAASTSPAPELAQQRVVDSLAGEWRVAGIDGADFNQPVGIVLSGSDRELWWEPRCAGLVRTYRIVGRRLTIGSPQGQAGEPGFPPPPVCTIAVPAELGRVVAAIDAATTVGRTPQNGVLLSGGGHSLLLFAQ